MEGQRLPADDAAADNDLVNLSNCIEETSLTAAEGPPTHSGTECIAAAGILSSPHELHPSLQIVSPRSPLTSAEARSPWRSPKGGTQSPFGHGIQLDLTRHALQLGLRGILLASSSSSSGAPLLSLVLRDCALESLELLQAAAGQLCALTHLDASANAGLRSVRDAHINALPALRALVLNDCGLRALPALALPALTALSAAGNRLRSARGVERLARLRELSLARNAIASMRGLHAFVPLAAARALTALDLTGNPVALLPRHRLNMVEMVPSVAMLNGVAIRAPWRLLRTARMAPPLLPPPPPPPPLCADLSAISMSSVCASPERKARRHGGADTPALPLNLSPQRIRDNVAGTPCTGSAGQRATAPLSSPRAPQSPPPQRARRAEPDVNGYCSDAAVRRALAPHKVSDASPVRSEGGVGRSCVGAAQQRWSGSECGFPVGARAAERAGIAAPAAALRRPASAGARAQASEPALRFTRPASVGAVAQRGRGSSSSRSGTPSPRRGGGGGGGSGGVRSFSSDRGGGATPPSPRRLRQMSGDEARARPFAHWDRRRWQQGMEQATAALMRAAARRKPTSDTQRAYMERLSALPRRHARVAPAPASPPRTPPRSPPHALPAAQFLAPAPRQQRRGAALTSPGVGGAATAPATADAAPPGSPAAAARFAEGIALERLRVDTGSPFAHYSEDGDQGVRRCVSRTGSPAGATPDAPGVQGGGSCAGGSSGGGGGGSSSTGGGSGGGGSGGGGGSVRGKRQVPLSALQSVLGGGGCDAAVGDGGSSMCHGTQTSPHVGAAGNAPEAGASAAARRNRRRASPHIYTGKHLARVLRESLSIDMDAATARELLLRMDADGDGALSAADVIMALPLLLSIAERAAGLDGADAQQQQQRRRSVAEEQPARSRQRSSTVGLQDGCGSVGSPAAAAVHVAAHADADDALHRQRTWRCGQQHVPQRSPSAPRRSACDAEPYGQQSLSGLRDKGDGASEPDVSAQQTLGDALAAAELLRFRQQADVHSSSYVTGVGVRAAGFEGGSGAGSRGQQHAQRASPAAVRAGARDASQSLRPCPGPGTSGSGNSTPRESARHWEEGIASPLGSAAAAADSSRRSLADALRERWAAKTLALSASPQELHSFGSHHGSTGGRGSGSGSSGGGGDDADGTSHSDGSSRGSRSSGGDAVLPDHSHIEPLLQPSAAERCDDAAWAAELQLECPTPNEALRRLQEIERDRGGLAELMDELERERLALEAWVVTREEAP